MVLRVGGMSADRAIGQLAQVAVTADALQDLYVRLRSNPPDTDAAVRDALEGVVRALGGLVVAAERRIDGLRA